MGHSAHSIVIRRRPDSRQPPSPSKPRATANGDEATVSRMCRDEVTLGRETKTLQHCGSRDRELRAKPKDKSIYAMLFIALLEDMNLGSIS